MAQVLNRIRAKDGLIGMSSQSTIFKASEHISHMLNMLLYGVAEDYYIINESPAAMCELTPT
jgi:hypothetical protein